MLRVLLVLSLMPGCSLFLSDEGEGRPDGGGNPIDASSDRTGDAAPDLNNNFREVYGCDDETLALYHFDTPIEQRACPSTIGDLIFANGSNPASGQGGFDGAMLLDKENDAAVIPLVPRLVPPLTIEAWANPTMPNMNGVERRYIFSLQGKGGNPSIGLFLQSTGTPTSFAVGAEVQSKDCGNSEMLGPSGAVEVNTWKHAALTIDGSFADLFLDGTLVLTIPLDGLCESGDLTALVGNAASTVSGRDFDHAIDELRISSTIRFVE